MNFAPPRSQWLNALQGLFTVVFGLVAIAWPGITLFSFILLFGVFAVANGLVRAAGAFANRQDSGWRLSLLAGIAGVAAGIVAFVWPGLTGLALLFVIAAHALFVGVMIIVRVIGSWKDADEKWLALIGGGVAVAFGILAIVWPKATALSLAWVIGVYAVVFGVSEIVSSFMSKNRQETP